MPLSLSSPAFPHHGEIPETHTCDGANTHPPLAWSGLPAGTRSLVLIVDDPDAPDPRAPTHTHVHWVLYDLPPSVAEIPSGQGIPTGAREGLNSWKRRGYGGPCPPTGRHRYFFKLYALDAMLGDVGAATKDHVEQAMRGHVVEQAELVGTYQRVTASRA